jgi:hypothetical protein
LNYNVLKKYTGDLKPNNFMSKIAQLERKQNEAQLSNSDLRDEGPVSPLSNSTTSN